MENIQNIRYPLTVPSTWYKRLIDQGLGYVEGDTFVFNDHIGKGKLVFFEFQEGIWVQQMNLVLKSPLQLFQESTKDNELFIINIYLTNTMISQYTEDRNFVFSYDRLNVVLSSSAAEEHYSIPPNEVVKMVQIGFTRKWLLDNAFDSKDEQLRSLFTKDKPIYFSENLNFKFKKLLEDFTIGQCTRLSLFSKTLELINSLFTQFKERNIRNENFPYIHPQDTASLIMVRNCIENNPLEFIKLETLAEMAGMSLSKFQRLFKQVFGLTPYKYHLKYKLDIAMDMLQSKSYTVSEVGFLIGYTNLSQFAKAFKMEFNILPSEVNK